MVMVPRKNLEPVDMSFEQAMGFAVPAGMPVSNGVCQKDSVHGQLILALHFSFI